MVLKEIVEKITEAPRRATEAIEEKRDQANAYYKKKREASVEKEAAQRQRDRNLEATGKLAKGDISKETYDKRIARYKETYEQEKVPIEKRAVRETERVLEGKNETINTFSRGIADVREKMDYRPMPQPRFTASRKGASQKKGTARPIKGQSGSIFGRGSAIDFSRMGNLGTGMGSGGTIDFSQPLFGKRKKGK